MTIDEAIKIKSKYQYSLQDASLPELIEADNLSIEALKAISEKRKGIPIPSWRLLPGETED